VGIIKSVLILLVGASLATFLWSNFEDPVIIYFTKYFHTVEIPLAAALIGAMVAGFLVAVTVSQPNQFRLRTRIREQQRKIDRLEDELRGLRKLPLNDTFPDTTSSESTEKEGKSVQAETHGS
jgi:uncharacterized integral membrane protein